MPKLLQANVNRLSDLQDQSVDIVYFFGLLEHIIDTTRFVKEIYRVLKRQGTVVGVTPNALCPWYHLRPLFRGGKKHCTSDRFYTRKQIENIFSREKFEFKKAVYWGMVPPGLKSRMIFGLLVSLKPLFQRTLLRKFLGGIAFKFQKR